MQVLSKTLLMQKGEVYYTLNVSLNPTSATCTLTYDGVAHTATSATVLSGTIISYSIYHATYGTQTGTITMDSNKTLTANGTYSTTTTGVSWTQPTLSANGTLGGSTMAVASSRQPYNSNTDVWKAFDGNRTSSSSTWYPAGTGSSGIPITLTIYIPTKIRITNFMFTNGGNANNAPNALTIYVSTNDSNSSYTQLKTYTNTNQTSNSTWNVSLPNYNNYYSTYYQIVFTEWNGASVGGRRVKEIDITATKIQTSYTYYWDITIT